MRQASSFLMHNDKDPPEAQAGQRFVRPQLITWGQQLWGFRLHDGLDPGNSSQRRKAGRLLQVQVGRHVSRSAPSSWFRQDSGAADSPFASAQAPNT